MATYEDRFNTTTGDQTFTGSIDPAGGFTGTGGLATSTNAGLVKKHLKIRKGPAGFFDGVGASNLLPLANIPQGTYRVIVSVAETTASATKNSYVYPHLNGSPYGVQLGITGFGLSKDATIANVSNVRIIDFPNPTNTFHLDVIVDAGSRLSGPEYTLERLENSETITTEWD